MRALAQKKAVRAGATVRCHARRDCPHFLLAFHNRINNQSHCQCADPHFAIRNLSVKRDYRQVVLYRHRGRIFCYVFLACLVIHFSSTRIVLRVSLHSHRSIKIENNECVKRVGGNHHGRYAAAFERCANVATPRRARPSIAGDNNRDVYATRDFVQNLTHGLYNLALRNGHIAHRALS